MKALLSTCGLMAGLALAIPAQATCTQANLAGTWTATSVSQQNNYVLAWVACNITIDTQGNFSTGKSGCVASNGQESRATGSLKLGKAADCAYAGKISFPIFGTTDVIQLATLSMDHQVVSGLGGGLGAGGVFVFNMVRTK